MATSVYREDSEAARLIATILACARRSARYRPDISLLEQRALLSTLYAVGSGVGDGTSHLYQIDDYAASPTAVDIGPSGTILTDLAVDPLNDAAYGISFTDLYSVNLNTGKAVEIGALGISDTNALTFSATGTLYAMSADRSDLYTVNLTTGKATVVFDTGFTAYGDLAFETDGSLYLTAPTDLVKIDLSDDTVTDVGSMGVHLFGLIVDSSGNMYGGEGANGGSTAIMFSVNTMTGAATEIGVIAGASKLGLYGLSFDYPPLPPPLDGTTTSLQASPLSSVYGQSIELSAAVSPSAGSSGTPTRLGHILRWDDRSGHLSAQRRNRDDHGRQPAGWDGCDRSHVHRRFPLQTEHVFDCGCERSEG